MWSETNSTAMAVLLLRARRMQVGCPDCILGSATVATDAPVELNWGGTILVTEDSDEAIFGICHRRIEVAAGRYRVRVRVFDGVNGSGEPQGDARIVEVDFELPAASGVVEVALD